MGKEVLSAKKYIVKVLLKYQFRHMNTTTLYRTSTETNRLFYKVLLTYTFEDKNGDIILVDYKTDKCTSKAEQLAVAKKYEKQLILYARAMEKS